MFTTNFAIPFTYNTEFSKFILKNVPINRLFLLIITILSVQQSSAQNSLEVLNSLLQTNTKICIRDEWYEVVRFTINELDGARFNANVIFIDPKSYIKESEYIISNYSPYHIEDGKWVKINGEYHQKGDTRKIHFYTNSEYGSFGFDIKGYRKDGALSHHDILNGFSLFSLIRKMLKHLFQYLMSFKAIIIIAHLGFAH